MLLYNWRVYSAMICVITNSDLSCELCAYRVPYRVHPGRITKVQVHIV